MRRCVVAGGRARGAGKPYPRRRGHRRSRDPRCARAGEGRTATAPRRFNRRRRSAAGQVSPAIRPAARSTATRSECPDVSCESPRFLPSQDNVPSVSSAPRPAPYREFAIYPERCGVLTIPSFFERLLDRRNGTVGFKRWIDCKRSRPNSGSQSSCLRSSADDAASKARKPGFIPGKTPEHHRSADETHCASCIKSSIARWCSCASCSRQLWKFCPNNSGLSATEQVACLRQ